MLALLASPSDPLVNPLRLFSPSLALALSLLGVTVAREASAQEDHKARAAAHFTRGVELAKAANYQDALLEFQRAYELTPHYSVLYNIGQAYIGLGKPVPAIDALKRYLAEGGAQIGIDRRRAVEAEIVKQFAQTGSVAVEVNLPGASILVDGELVGRSPLAEPVRVPLGEHRISARLESGEESEQRVTIASEQSLSVKLELRATEAPSATNAIVFADCARPQVRISMDGVELGASPLRAPIQLAPGAHRVVFKDDTQPNLAERAFSLSAGQTLRLDCGWTVLPPQTTRSHHRATWGYVVAALGVGLGGAAVAHFVWNHGRYEDWNDEYALYQQSPTAERRLHANALASSVERASLVTVLLGVGAGVALGTGTLLIVTDGGSGQSVDPKRTGLAFRGSF